MGRIVETRPNPYSSTSSSIVALNQQRNALINFKHIQRDPFYK